MQQYLDIIKDILDNGIDKGPARPGMPATKEVFFRTMQFDLSEGFPLLTTKKMFIKGFVVELLWFLSGSRSIKPLIDNGVHIWDGDVYRYYKARGGVFSKEDWLNHIKANKYAWPLSSAGKIYGVQWRDFDGYDQITELIKTIRTNPNSRYQLVTAWNPADFFLHKNACLPACHVMFQTNVRGNKLDIMMLQRSCDMFLGVPFDLASYGLLCHILARATGLEPGIFTWVGNSCHLYENHIEQAKEIITRKPYPLCELVIKTENTDFNGYKPEDFEFVNYMYHPAIKAPLSTGE